MNETADHNLSMPADVYRQLRHIAEREGLSLGELLRRATRPFLFFRSIKQDPQAHVLVEREDETQEIVLDLV
jgi:hypothetical protein